MTRKLEDVTPEEFWQMYVQQNPPPPDLPPEEYEFVRQIYYAGFGAMWAVAKRLDSETPERRADILARLEAQIWTTAREMAGNPKLDG